MAIESGPSIDAPVLTPTSVGGEVPAGSGHLNYFSSLSSFSEFSTKIISDSPAASIQGFYPLEGLANPGGVNEGPVSRADIPLYSTVIAQAQVPEVTLTEKSGLKEPPIYDVRSHGIERLSPIFKEPNSPGLADIDFSLPSKDLLDDMGLDESSTDLEAPREIAKSLRDVNLDPDRSPEFVPHEIDQSESLEDPAEKEIIYPELNIQTGVKAESNMLSETENTEMSIQVGEIIDSVKGLKLPDDQVAEVKEKVLEGEELAAYTSIPSLETLPQAVTIEGELAGSKPLLVVEELRSGEVTVAEPLGKTSEQVQMKQAIEALLDAHISVAQVQEMLQPVAQEKGLEIVVGGKIEEETEDQELAAPQVRELQEVLTGLKTVPTSQTETSAQNRYHERVLARIQKIIHLRRDDRAAKNRREALKVATEQAFKLRDEDLSNRFREVSGVEIVAQVNAPEDKINSAVHPGGPEEGWALTLAEFARRKFENPEQALEFAEELVLRKIQPVEEADEPNPPVSIEELRLAISRSRNPRTLVDSLKSQLSSLPNAA